MRIDLHTHSNVSDGSLSPTELVELARDEGVDCLALTDHDDVGGIAPARARADALGIGLIAGVEISVCEDGGETQLHLLGLGVDPQAARLERCLAGVREARVARGRRIVERLNECGVALDFEAVLEQTAGETVGRPHVARALVAAGHVREPEEAFARWLRRGRPAYEPSAGTRAAEAIAAVRAAGGVAVLAHPPLSVGVGRPGGLDAFVRRLVALGLDGVETWHPSHKANTVKRLRRLARESDLLETGGSDFHGADRPDARLGRSHAGRFLGAEIHAALQGRLRARAQSPRSD